MENILDNEINFVKKNSFETLYLNLNYGDVESIPLVKIGTKIYKGEQIAGGSNVPNIFSPVNATVKDIKKIRIGQDNIVSTHIELVRDFDDAPKKNNVVRDIKSPIDFLEEIESKGVIDCQENCDIYCELSKKISKIKNLILNFYDIDEYTHTYKYLFSKKKNDIVSIIDFMNNIFKFNKITIVCDKRNYDDISEYNDLFNKCKISVEYIIIKDNVYYNTIAKIKLKSIKFTTKDFAKKNSLYLDAKTLYDIFVAIRLNQPITSTYITINGDAIQNVGIYKMPLGVALKEIIELAKTKNSYDYIDNYFYNAMEAHNDKISFEKEISEEKDESVKQDLIRKMNEKDKEAHETIFSKIDETREYYQNCLGLIYEVKGHNQIGVYSQYNVIGCSTSALIMVTKKTLKTL